MVANKFRNYENDLVKYYEIEVNKYKMITLKSYVLENKDGKSYFLKESNDQIINKYLYLESKSISNVLYPLPNKDRNYVTKSANKTFYVNDYYPQSPLRDDVKATSLFVELKTLHNSSVIKKRLDPSKSRFKFEELTKQLDYKFKMLEQIVRNKEAKPLDIYSLPILENYHIILNAKKELIKLQKRIISSVKARESVDYSFIHNNPSIDHLINVRGINYLTSFDHGKIGINSLDMAKFYVDNLYLDVDFKSMILNQYYNEASLFYYDYFRFLVLVILIKRMNISTEDFVNANMFVSTSRAISRYFEDFSDYEKKASEPYNANDNA